MTFCDKCGGQVCEFEYRKGGGKCVECAVGYPGGCLRNWVRLGEVEAHRVEVECKRLFEAGKKWGDVL